MKVLVPFYRGAVVFSRLYHRKEKYGMFSSPFIEERLYLTRYSILIIISYGSRPLLSRSGCISKLTGVTITALDKFSSPFIEERLYLKAYNKTKPAVKMVLVPFYRGAVVFNVL